MLVLPTKIIPTQLQFLVEQQAKVQTRMVNGFRNRLLLIPSLSQSQSQSQLQLVLTKDAKYCGRAFCYSLKQQQLPTQETNVISQMDMQVDKISSQYKNKDQQLSKEESKHFACRNIEKAGRNYVLVYQTMNKNEAQAQVKQEHNIFNIDWKKQQINVTQINSIIDMLTIQGETPDVAKNIILSSFDNYDSLVQSGLTQHLMPGNKSDNTMPTIISDKSTLSKYSGENLLRVPKCNLKTGEWSKEDTILLKIQNKIKNTQPTQESNKQLTEEHKQENAEQVAKNIVESLQQDKKQVY